MDVVPAGSWASIATFQRRNSSDTVLFIKGCSPNRQLVGQRRRWESNPLRPGCNRLPCRLAPASCSVPCRESNLIFDHRKVACVSGTLQGQFVEYLAWESNPVLRLHKPPCKPLHLQGLFQQPAEESNPVLQNRSLPCDPAHSQAMSIPTWT